MKIDKNWRKITKPCCKNFAELFSYDYFEFDDGKFTFPNEEEKPLKYCMFCGKKIVIET